jgi:drug/metabolite transporter (DMT)-like permease
VSRRGWLLFGTLCIIWGIPYWLIRVAVREVSPPTLVFLRTAVASVLLAPVAWRHGHVRPVLARWRWLLAYTIAELVVPWLLLFRAEQHITSSLAGLLIAVVPLLGAVLYRFSSTTERLDALRLAGLLVGFAGVAALVGLDVGHVDLFAVAEMGIVALGYTLGPFIISRRLADLPGLGVVSASLVLTTVGYAPVALTHLPAILSGETIGAVAALALVCTALAFLVFFELILEVGPSRTTVITYVNPVVALLLGVGLLGEPFTTGMAIGFPLVLVGSILATRRAASSTASAAGEPPMP